MGIGRLGGLRTLRLFLGLLPFFAACTNTAATLVTATPVASTDAGNDIGIEDLQATGIVNDIPSIDVVSNDLTPDAGNQNACPGGPGCPCAQNADCQTALCIEDPNVSGGMVCARTCVETCPDNYQCAQVSMASGDVVSICVAKLGHLCDPCSADSDCKSLGLPNASCVEQGALGHFCGISCSIDADCPADYSCSAVTTVSGGNLKQCVRKPDGTPSPYGVCPCTQGAIDKKLSTSCYVEVKDAGGQVVGQCQGKRVCSAAGLGNCAAPSAQPEVCNGLDDNCNGQTDEGSCDDQIACTQDACAGANGCQNKPLDGTPCDDGDACTTGDACSAGVCAGSAPACGNGSCDCSEIFATCPADCAPAGMVLIPAGTFWMGCNAAKDGSCSGISYESPQHKVTLSSYYMDITETTVGQFNACVDAGACAGPTQSGPTNNPVANVIWEESQAYCKWRGAAFDLPTEAQWEMAARGSCEKNGSTADDAGCAASMRTYPWGEAAATCNYAVMYDDGVNYGCGTNTTWAVGSKAAGDSPYGLHDMAGSVWEWARDSYGAYSPGAAVDPVAAASDFYRVIRGGGFDAVAVDLRAGFRYYYADANVYIGQRCMRSYP